MHGSFDVSAVKKFYGFYGSSPKTDFSDFSEGGLYDFSSAGMNPKIDGKNSKKGNKVSIAEKHKKAKTILDEANHKMLEDFSEENLHRLELAQKLFDLTSQRYAREQEEHFRALQYSEEIGPEDLSILL